MNPIEAFYTGQSPDDRGRTIDEIWAWDDEALEDVHDYIQWLFPSRRPSQFNPRAPLLTPDLVQAFRSNPDLRRNLLKSFRRMLAFYGFEEAGDGAALSVQRSGNWRERFEVWLSRNNHNHLRLTRILACLRDVGLPGQAHALLAALEAVDRDFPRIIDARTIDFWRSAAGR